MKDWTTSVCQRAVSTWGKNHQLIICMEEMAELTKEISKNLRGQDNDLGLAEEIADVEIMLEQLKLIFDIRTDVECVKSEKLIRRDRRIREADGNDWRSSMARQTLNRLFLLSQAELGKEVQST